MFLNENLFTDFLTEKEILWLGIDFSKAKFTKKGFDLPIDTLRQHFNGWNLLVISDQKKYDIRLSFRKPIMSYDLSALSKRNRTIRLSNILKDHIHLNDLLDEVQIQHYIGNIEIPQQHRFALLFIVESFDAVSKTGSVWVTVAETASRQIVLCEKFIKQPGGFGIRNYWGRIFYNILFDIKNYTFCRWENLVKKDTTTTDIQQQHIIQ